MPEDSGGRLWLRNLFWAAAGGSTLLVLVPAAQELAHPRGEFSGLLVIGLLVIAAVLAMVAVTVAIIRKPMAYGIGLIFVVPPLLWWASESLTDLVRNLKAPPSADQEAGRGYFTAPADRALADAIVAGDAGRVAALAPAANLGAVGWDNMTFMHLALEPAQPDRAVLGALPRASIDPAQDGSNLFSLIYNEKDEALLRLVIDRGGNLNRMGRGEWIYYVRYDWPEGLALMLDHGVDLETEDAMGYTEIMRATQDGSWPIVETLLAHGARTDHVGHDRKTLRDLLAEAIAQSRDPIPPRITALQATLH